jgi:hypothetical protein
MDYANVPDMFARTISRGFASMIELQTVYGTEDFYNLYEIINVNAYNSNAIK